MAAKNSDSDIVWADIFIFTACIATIHVSQLYIYFHDTQVSALKSLLIEGFRHIRSHNRRLVDYSPQRPGTLCRKNGRSRSQSDDEFRHWYGMTTKSTERRGEFEFYLIVKAHTPVVTFSMVM